MKIQRSFQLVALFAAVSLVLFSSCQKQEIETPQVNNEVNSDEFSVSSADENLVLKSADIVKDDVDNLLALGASNLKNGFHWQCNMTIDSTDVINDTITYFITYDGLTCNERIHRTGQVEVRRAKHVRWWEEGASVEITYFDLTITRIATGRTIVLNGQETYENESGGLFLHLGHGISSLTHKVYGALDITFDDGKTKSWNIARRLIYSGEIDDLICAVEGFGSTDDYQNLVVWGTNRNGKEFYTQINQTNVVTEACEWNAISGIRAHHVPVKERTITLTFGFNDNDEPISEDECPTKYKVDWVEGNNFGTMYLPL